MGPCEPSAATSERTPGREGLPGGLARDPIPKSKVGNSARAAAHEFTRSLRGSYHSLWGYDMKNHEPEHSLEFLLAFDGRIDWLEQGYRIEFRIGRVPPEGRRPHGLAYAFTLHAPDGTRLLGFDNARAVPAAGARRQRSQAATDHWHRSGTAAGRPYEFVDAATLVNDFLVERTLAELGVSANVVGAEDRRRRK